MAVSDPGLIGDSDGDGMSDEAEALAGTDPSDPDDILRVQSVMRVADGVRLTWSSVVDKRYLIDYAGELHPGAWEVIGEISADGASLEFEDFDAARTQSGEGSRSNPSGPLNDSELAPSLGCSRLVDDEILAIGRSVVRWLVIRKGLRQGLAAVSRARRQHGACC